jgi:hypothetical protein
VPSSGGKVIFLKEKKQSLRPEKANVIIAITMFTEYKYLPIKRIDEVEKPAGLT